MNPQENRSFLFLLFCAFVAGCLFFHYHREEATELWDKMNKPSLNEEAIPPLVLSALSCFKKINNKDFYPLGFLLEKGGFYQRLAEGAWPIEISAQSKVRVLLQEELPILCPKKRILCIEGEVAVALCHI